MIYKMASLGVTEVVGNHFFHFLRVANWFYSAPHYWMYNLGNGTYIRDDIYRYFWASPPQFSLSSHLSSLIPFSQQQADTTVINEEEVTCHLLHFSHFVLNVISVIDSAGSRCPNAFALSSSCWFQRSVISGRAKYRNNNKQQASSRRTDQI